MCGEVSKKIKVSVFVVCYNHESFIHQAMNGIVSQDTNFDYEVLIYDDLSSDNTRKVIDEFVACENKNSKCTFKKIYADENQYSKGITMSSVIIPMAKGEFIAFCEGDDYWIDNNKLQKQYDLLKNNLSIDISFHPSLTLHYDIIEDLSYGYLGDEEKIISYQDVILKGGSMMPMASIMCRKKILLEIISLNEEFFRKNLYHSILQTIMVLGKGALYIPGKMSVYRSMHNGSWSLQQKLDKVKRKEELKAFNRRLWTLNKIYNNRYIVPVSYTHL
ncbi:glycosyltransferase family 2 protein, partial [Vibrio vulnificus]|nr:glycosyltransferase family 2 protein [Vibrio vulnificus]